jgi:hypothetical protein
MKNLFCFFLLLGITGCAEYGTVPDGDIRPGMSFNTVMRMYKTLGSAQEAARGVPNILVFKTSDNHYLYFKESVLISNADFQILLSEHLINLQKQKEDSTLVVEENKGEEIQSEMMAETLELEPLPPASDELRKEQEKYMREHGKFMKEQERLIAERDAIEARKRQQLKESNANKKVDDALTLKDFYEASMATSDCYEIRKNYNTQYINASTRDNVLRKMKLIEKDFLRKDPKINKNALWEEATLGYNKGLSKLIEVGYLMPNKVIGDVNSICLMTSMMIMTYEVEAGMNKQRIKNF